MNPLSSVPSVPTNPEAVQRGPTSVEVSWRPPYRLWGTLLGTGSPTPLTTPARVSRLMVATLTEYLLTGLVNGATYLVSVRATSHHLSSSTLVSNTHTHTHAWVNRCMYAQTDLQYCYTFRSVDFSMNHICVRHAWYCACENYYVYQIVVILVVQFIVPLPSQPTVNVISISSTSISLS